MEIPHLVPHNVFEVFQCFSKIAEASGGLLELLEASWGLLGACRGALRVLLGASWDLLGPLGGLLVVSWELLGGVLGRLGNHLEHWGSPEGATFAIVGCSWGFLACSRSLLGRVLLDSLRMLLGACWKPLGRILQVFSRCPR